MQQMPRLQAMTSEQAVVLIDQGRFGFNEFSASYQPSSDDALPVTGGIHIVELVPSELACRTLAFAALDPALKVLVPVFGLLTMNALHYLAGLSGIYACSGADVPQSIPSIHGTCS